MEYSPRKGGGERPGASSPSSSPSHLCQVPRETRKLTVRDRGGTRFVGSVRPVKSDYETRRRRDSEGRARTPDRGPGSPRRVAAESLDTEVDEDAEAAWASEINRRVAELETGVLRPIPWADVRRRLAQR
jgi:putative addiction module component